MGDSDLSIRSRSEPWEPFDMAPKVDEAKHAQKINGSSLSVGRALFDAGVAKLPDAPPALLSPEAYRNPALLGGQRMPSPLDPCATAAPTRIVAGPRKRGEEVPNQIEFSCTKKGGVCLTKEETAQLQAAREAACRTTGMDPFRFQQVAPRGPEVGRDRDWEESQRLLCSRTWS